MAFRYQAIDSAGQTVDDVVDVGSATEAADLLRDRGLFVTQLDEGHQVDAHSTSAGQPGKGVKFRDVVLFTQQMSMLLRSGAQVFEALDTLEDVSRKPGWQTLIARLRLDVEEGRPLSTALAQFPKLFSGIYVSMITAGEASGELGLAFERLSVLTREQQEVRNRIIGAISYPIVLTFLCIAVIVIMVGFILPRFTEMFEALDVDLPMTTTMLIAASEWSQVHYPYLLAGLAGAGIGAYLFLKSPTGHRYTSFTVLRLPIFGKLIRNITVARICRIWGQLLESKVDLLNAIDLIQRGTKNHEFAALLGQVVQTVTDGNPIGNELRASWLIPKTYAGAVATGETSGRLTDSLLFVATSLEDQNTEALGSLARVIEPLILAVMGLVVGVIAFSLFLPMFDMATAAGG